MFLFIILNEKEFPSELCLKKCVQLLLERTKKALAKGVTISNKNKCIGHQKKDGFASCKEIEENETK
jgi:hypothetical protein